MQLEIDAVKEAVVRVRCGPRTGTAFFSERGLVTAFHVVNPADAIEVHHPDHDDVSTGRYRQFASQYSLLVTGGSDYHGIGSGRTAGLGRIGLGAHDYARLVERAGWPGNARQKA